MRAARSTPSRRCPRPRWSNSYVVLHLYFLHPVDGPHSLGRSYVGETCRPCWNLEKLPKERGRTRVLNESEINIFWHGLDRNDLPWDRRTRLALKFELVTMLRSGELLAAHRDELVDLNGTNPRFDVPLKRVKKRRVIEQPLSGLAVEIIKEALASDEQQFVLESPVYKGQPIHRTNAPRQAFIF